MAEGEEAEGFDPGQDMVAYIVAAEELDNSDEERRRVRQLDLNLPHPPPFFGILFSIPLSSLSPSLALCLSLSV